MSNTNVYVPYLAAGRKGGLGFAVAWLMEFVSMLSKEISMSETYRTLSMISVY